MKLLAIETSCDECSAAVLVDGELKAVATKTQQIHRAFGGVVPELAGRSHLELIDVLVDQALDAAAVAMHELELVAATVGPGLVGSLLVGANYARGLAQATGCGFRAIHHVEAHLWSAELTAGKLPLPFLVLLASGGHTLLVRISGLRRYDVLGSTLDDALGEAYDKVGKLVGLPFPAGADVDRLAARGNAVRHSLPQPLRDDSLNFSFSGLKTAFLRRMQEHASLIADDPADLLAAFQETALQSVMSKVRKAVPRTQPRALVLAGGVAANSRLRALMSELGTELAIPVHAPALRFCGDNAAMIGYLAWRLHTEGIKPDDEQFVRPRWPLTALPGG